MNFFRFMMQNRGQVLELTGEHLWLVGVSTLLAVFVGLPLGIMIARWPRWNKPVLAGANIIQTIPSLALFGFLLPVPWLGARVDRLAILALTLYALLPVIRNTYTGIRGVDPAVVEAGRGMGMPNAGPGQAYWRPIAFGITNEADTRKAVDELAAKKADIVKIWVDDRNGTVQKLSPALYRAIIDEAHKHGTRVIAHVYYLDDAKDLARASIDGFANAATPHRPANIIQPRKPRRSSSSSATR